MLFFHWFVLLALAFFLPNVLSLIMGLWLVKTRRFHRLGVRLLAMSMLVSGRCVACKCEQHCEIMDCGNWTCANYEHSKK